MKLGYARVSTEDQRLDLQRARLTEAGCGRLFEEKISGAARQRPALELLLRELRADDVLVVTRVTSEDKWRSFSSAMWRRSRGYSEPPRPHRW